MLGLLQAIAAFFKAIPYVGDFVKWLSEMRTARDERQNEIEALDRKTAKDAAVDAYFERVRKPQSGNTITIARPAESHHAPDGPPGLSSSSRSIAELGARRAQDHQRLGTGN